MRSPSVSAAVRPTPLFSDTPASIALAVLVLFVLLALAAPWIAPQNPHDLAQLDVLDSKLAPGVSGSGGRIFWFGSDDQGRDMASAMLYGLRVSLGVGVAATLFALMIGSAAGLIAARAGGWMDALIMRTVDLQLSFPAILVALVLLATTGQGIDKIIFALVIVQWAYYARTVRGAALSELRREYVDAAVCAGVGTARLLVRHVMPNILPALSVVACAQIAQAIALEATLSFLGLGLPITEPSLGLLIANGYAYLLSGAYWISMFPGLVLLVLIISINLVGDHLRDRMDQQSA